MSQTYHQLLQQHYESYFAITGNKLKWHMDPQKKMPENFYILEFVPNKKHNMWTYCTNGMSAENNDYDLIELFIFSPRQDNAITELLTVVASFHINITSLALNDTVNIGQPWLLHSSCDYGFISLPYLDGSELELFSFNNDVIHCYWLIPITETERDYKIANGTEALEQMFEDRQIDFLNQGRVSLI